MEKKNSVLGVLVILLSVVVLGLTGFIVYDKVLNKDAKNENTNSSTINNEVENTDGSSISSTEMLDKIVGNWGRVNGMACYLISISRKDNKYTFNSVEYGTDGGLFGEVVEHKSIDSDKLYLKVHFPERVNEVGETPEQTSEYVINISELSSNILIINNNKWEIVTGTLEEFFNSKIPNRF